MIIPHPSMIRSRRDPLCLEGSSDPLGSLLESHIDDRRTVFPMGKNPISKQVFPFRRGSCGRDRKPKIGPRKSGLDMIFLPDRETFADLFGDPGRCRCRQGEHPRHLEITRELGQLQVVGTEVVPPLRDTMGLVYGEEIDPASPEATEKTIVGKTFGSHVEKLQGPLLHFRVDPRNLFPLERRIQSRRCNRTSGERFDLIFHQGNQGGNDEGQSIEQQCGQLVAETFPTPCREESQGRASLEEHIDDLLLPDPKSIVSEIVEECLFFGHGMGDFAAPGEAPSVSL